MYWRNSRSVSVYKGLVAAKNLSPDKVLIHDVARPAVSEDIITDIILAINEETGEATVVDVPIDEGSQRLLHQTIASVADAMEGLRFNSAIARITELNNELTKSSNPVPLELAEKLVLMLAPLVPHIAEELWARLGHSDSVVHQSFPSADAGLLVEDSIELPVQVNGKVRSRIVVSTDASPDELETLALADERISQLTSGNQIRKVIVVPKKMINIVIS